MELYHRTIRILIKIQQKKITNATKEEPRNIEKGIPRQGAFSPRVRSQRLRALHIFRHTREKAGKRQNSNLHKSQEHRSADESCCTAGSNADQSNGTANQPTNCTKRPRSSQRVARLNYDHSSSRGSEAKRS